MKLIQNFLFSISLTLTAISASAQAFAHSFDQDALRQKITQFLAEVETTPDYPKDSGLAIAVIQKGEVVFSQGFGYADRETKSPVTENTLFAMGSCTKAFTTAALSLLREERRLDFDQPVRAFLPDFELKDAEVSRHITPRDLMVHRSGLPRHDFAWYFTPFSRELLFHKLRYFALNPKPEMGFRKGFQYNNLMYMTLGHLLERQIGVSWENFVENRIFKALNMSDSGFSAQEMQKAPDFAKPYNGDDELPFKEISSIGPAGSIHSNLRDMEKWLLMMMNQGQKPDGTQLLAPDTVGELTRGEIEIPKFGPGHQYGLGWFLAPVASETLVWHGGNIDGFSAHVSYMPSRDLGLIILTNLNGAVKFEFPMHFPAMNGQPAFDSLPLVIYQFLLGRQGGREGVLPQLGLTAWFDAPMPRLYRERGRLFLMSVPPEISPEISGLLGSYGDEGYGEVTVKSEEGWLVLNYYGHKALLAQKDTDVFDAPMMIWGIPQNFTARFQREDGRVISVSVDFEEAVDPIVFVRSR